VAHGQQKKPADFGGNIDHVLRVMAKLWLRWGGGKPYPMSL